MTRASLVSRGLPARRGIRGHARGATMLPFFPAFWAPAFAVAAAVPCGPGAACRARAGSGGSDPAARERRARARCPLRRDRARLAGPFLGRRAARAHVPGRPAARTARADRARAPGRAASQRPGSPRRARGRSGCSRGTRRRVARNASSRSGRASRDDRRCRHRERRDGATALAAAVPVGLVLAGFALAAIAVAIPYARTPWRIAGLGAGALTATLLAVPSSAGAAPRRRHLARPASVSALGPSIRLRSAGTPPCPHERPPCHRTQDRRPLRGDVRPCLPDARAARRARAQAREGDGRAPDDLRLTGLRAERVLGLPLGADREQFTGYEGSLIGELQDYLIEHARRESYAMLTPPKVLMQTDADLSIGEFGIATRMVQPEGRAPAARRAGRAGRAGRDDDLQGEGAPADRGRLAGRARYRAEEKLSLTMNGRRSYALEGRQGRARPLEGVRRAGRGRERLAAARRAAQGGLGVVARRPRLDERHRAERQARATGEARRTATRSLSAPRSSSSRPR